MKPSLSMGILFVVYSLFTLIDLILDWDEASIFHRFVEFGILGLSVWLAYSFTRAHRQQREETRLLHLEINRQRDALEQKERWLDESQRWRQGISESIDRQLESWGLSKAEKEIALLLLKGLSIREISEIRKTAEKTARAQSLAVYQKSGLAGRAEFAAFFLEDVLVLPASRPIVVLE